MFDRIKDESKIKFCGTVYKRSIPKKSIHSKKNDNENFFLFIWYGILIQNFSFRGRNKPRCSFLNSMYRLYSLWTLTGREYKLLDLNPDFCGHWQCQSHMLLCNNPCRNVSLDRLLKSIRLLRIRRSLTRTVVNQNSVLLFGSINSTNFGPYLINKNLIRQTVRFCKLWDKLSAISFEYYHIFLAIQWRSSRIFRS